jgi:hypothetical protein
MYLAMAGDLKGKLMCYYCRHVFPIPENAVTRFTDVTCPKCSFVDMRQHFKADESDPLRHPLGWPYDDPTVPYDC